MTVPRFVMDTTRLSVSPAGVNALTSAARDNIFDTRLAGALGVLLQGQTSIPAVGSTTTIMLPRSIGTVGTCSAIFNLTQGVPTQGGVPGDAATQFAAGRWALAAGALIGVRTNWPGLIPSAFDQYRWILRLTSDRITVTQERNQSGSVNGAAMAGTIRYTVFQDNL